MKDRDTYLIEAVAKALDVLEMFQTREEIRLTDVVRQLGLVKSTAFRLLYTLERKGYIEHTPGGRGFRRRQRFRIGMLSISATIPFVSEVEASIQAESARAGLELLIRHHEFSAQRALAAVDELLGAGISMLVGYNPDEYVAHAIADRCANAQVPVIAITFPMPGARLFGINNFRAGLAGGEGLSEEIIRRWNGDLDWAVLLDIPGNSPAQQARMRGMLDGLRRNVIVPDSRVIHLHTDRSRLSPRDLIRDCLAEHPHPGRIAVMCYNDLNALGALAAVEAAGRPADVLILSQGGVADVREQIRRPGCPLWGAVAHFPERFGGKLIPLAMRVLRGEPAPQTTYTDHALLTGATLGRYYRREDRSAVRLDPQPVHPAL